MGPTDVLHMNFPEIMQWVSIVLMLVGFIAVFCLIYAATKAVIRRDGPAPTKNSIKSLLILGALFFIGLAGGAGGLFLFLGLTHP